MNAALEIKNLSKNFNVWDNGKRTIRSGVLRFYRPKSNRKIQALSEINFHVEKGEIFGIIGANGSGKSTLLNCILGSIKPNKHSEVILRGKAMRLAMGMGFDPNLTARENIYINGSIIGLSFKEIGTKFDSIISFADLHKFVDVPVKTYSRGMQTRLKFSIAINAKADVFLFDEFFGGAGDLEFKKRSHELFEKRFLVDETIIVASHNLNLIEKYCNRVLVLRDGRMNYLGNASEAVKIYKSLDR